MGGIGIEKKKGRKEYPPAKLILIKIKIIIEKIQIKPTGLGGRCLRHTVGGQKGGGQSGGKPPEKEPRWGGLAVKGGQAELIGGILFINR